MHFESTPPPPPPPPPTTTVFSGSGHEAGDKTKVRVGRKRVK